MRTYEATNAVPGGSFTTIAPYSPSSQPRRIVASGKFLVRDGETFFIRGVAYGPFQVDAGGCEYHGPTEVAADFALMRSHGINTVRTYNVPPRWLLDLAHQHDLHVIVGLAWEQHVAFLDRRATANDILRRMREAVRTCAHHPAVLAYTIGNEIPATIVRWYGHRRVERFLKRLASAVRAEDPGVLVTYVNYPSTEYLDLRFLDFVAFNVYLETPEKLAAYVARLQNIAEDRPLLIAEMGLDELRNGADGQASSLQWQIECAFGGGCAGAVVFSWTDEWYRGGIEITDWRFGLTTVDRQAKPALAAVKQAFEQAPLAAPVDGWPMMSVIVCTYNGFATIEQCLRGLAELRYPNFEVIVVNDGSRDDLVNVIKKFDVRLISLPQRQGLSHARNVGLKAARGEYVAYIDDDAWPDAYWLHYLAQEFARRGHVGIGGPNLAPQSDCLIARCVAHSPGGPTHVLLSDTQAEHIPGCNMAFKRDALLEIGGFDPQFKIAGDDVDICWRLQANGGTLGFSPSAVVWHYRRRTVRAYWRQQFNYGKAESDLERKWPEKYNAVGHLTWSGRLYNQSLLRSFSLWKRQRIYHGTWGSALFQSVYHVPPSFVSALPAMPEWHLVVLILALLSVIAPIWAPLRIAHPALLIAAIIPIFAALENAMRATLAPSREPWWKFTRLRERATITLLHLLQPLARLAGRFTSGLTPWRRRGVNAVVFPHRRTYAIWSEQWQSADGRLRQLEAQLRDSGAAVLRGGDFDRWDLYIRGGMLGGMRVHLMTEEHGQGKQLVRIYARPALPISAIVLWCASGAPIWIAILAQLSPLYPVVAAIMLLLLSAGAGYDSASAAAALEHVMRPRDAGIEADADREVARQSPAPLPSAPRVPLRRVDPKAQQNGERIADEVLELSETWFGSEGST